MKIALNSTALEKILGITVQKRRRELLQLQAVFNEIVAEEWFDQTRKDEFHDYIAEKGEGSDMELAQARSVLISVARRFYARKR
jgi:hypothetical protein